MSNPAQVRMDDLAIDRAIRADERRRIREAVFAHPERLVGKRRHGETAMSWRQRALHAALEDPDVV